MNKLLAAMLSLLLSGCGFVHDETLVGRYRIIAVDTSGQMALCWSVNDRGDCVEQFGGETLFAAGFDAKYVVEAIHPNESDKRIAKYFYIIRDPKTEDTVRGIRYVVIKGPFDQTQYEVEKTRLHLPEFSRKFDDL